MQKVPITQALDNEIGIGYGDQNENNMINPLLEKIEFPNNGKSYEKKNNEFSSILLEKYINAKSKNQNEIILHKSDFKQIENLKNTKYPNTIYTLLNILNSENGPLIRLKNFCGSSASIPITRFYHLDKKINSFIKEIINKEEELMVGNPLIAEICHIPQSRVGNILFRPKLRNYEIQFLSNSISKDEFIIGINDLFIYYENDTIKLYSKRLNRQITPILTCAHNYNGSLNLPLYQFLCDLQNQQTKNDFYFSWGYLENILNHMPRVKYKNIILSPEQWYINSESMEYLHKIQSDTLLLDEINKWKDSYFLPSKVLLHEYDNDLLIDFNNILSIRTFLNCIKTKNKFILLEFITSKPEELVKDSNLNGYLNECILFFYKS